MEEGRGDEAPVKPIGPSICFNQAQWRCARSVVPLKKGPPHYRRDVAIM